MENITNPHDSDDLNKLDVEKIIIKVDFLVPGTKLIGDTYTFTGIKIKEALDPFSNEDIEDLKRKKIDEIYYIPMPKIERPAPKVKEKKEVPEPSASIKEIEPRKQIEIPEADEDVMISSSLKKTSMQTVGELYEKLKKNISVDIHGAFELIKTIDKETALKQHAYLNLLPLERRDDYLTKHSINVAILSTLLARQLKLTPVQVEAIGLGALLADIGMLMVPQDIVNKPDKLTAQEYKYIRKHTILGYNKLKEFKELNESIRKIAMLHHERMNGDGYPLGLNWKDIGLFPHITACADVFDAIITPRPYKKGFSYVEAIRYLFSTAGVTFHPKVVLPFIKYMTMKLKLKEIFEIGDYLLLNTGEIAQVEEKVSGIRKIEDQLRPELIFRPRIKILRDINKKYISRNLIIDLETEPSREIIKLIKDNNSISIIEEGVKQSKNKTPS